MNALLLLLLTLLVSVFSDDAPRVVSEKRLSDAEVTAMLAEGRASKERKRYVADPLFDKSEAERARERLSEARKHIQDLEGKRFEALERWEALGDEAKAEVLAKAEKRAEERKGGLKKDVQLSQRLDEVEQAETEERLHGELDEELKRIAGEDEQKMKHRDELREAEFERAKGEFLEGLERSRTWTKAVGVLGAVFFGAAGVTFLLNMGSKASESKKKHKFL